MATLDKELLLQDLKDSIEMGESTMPILDALIAPGDRTAEQATAAGAAQGYLDALKDLLELVEDGDYDAR